MEKMSHVVYVMENCDVLKVDWDCFDYFNVQPFNSGFLNVTNDNVGGDIVFDCRSFLMILNQNKVIKNTTLFDRLSENDIAWIEVYDIKGNKKCYQIEWENDWNPNYDEGQYAILDGKGRLLIGSDESEEHYAELIKKFV